MKQEISIILIAMCLLLGCASGIKARTVNDDPIPSFDLERYLGSWYEIARIEHSFEKGIEFTKAYYSLNDDGTVRVENSGIKKGDYKFSVGKAKRPDPDGEPARMRVSFFGPFYADYRVLMVDPDYQYALVSGRGPNYLWVLSRTPQLPDKILQSILTEAESRGFDTNRLKWVMQELK